MRLAFPATIGDQLLCVSNEFCMSPILSDRAGI